MITSFHNVWSNGGVSVIDDEEEMLEDREEAYDFLLAQIKITFDPSTGIPTVETVWQKEAK